MASKNGASIEQIRVSLLSIYEPVQRKPPTRARVKQMVDEFDLDKMGIITVSKRKGGGLSVLDGQTRVAALKDLGLEDWEATCNVYRNLTEATEAHLFRILNNTRKPTPYDDFRVGVTEGDPECLAITTIIARHGLKLAGNSQDGTIACVSQLRQSYRAGADSLDRALETATKAWGLTAAAVQGAILRGLAIVHETYGDEIDQSALINKLAKCKGGPSGLLGNARAARYARSAPITRLCAAAIISVYNRNRRTGALADL